jgi:hypothetical protein
MQMGYFFNMPPNHPTVERGISLTKSMVGQTKVTVPLLTELPH